MINNYDLLMVILEKINDINTFKDQYIKASREEFACNDMHIKLGLGIVEELVNITNKVDANIILASEYLTNEIPLLNRYHQNLFNPDNSVNAYKLYDFLTHEVINLENGIKDLVNR